MWVTDPMLDQGIQLMQDWGFKFKTVAFYWAKTNTKVDLKKLSSEKDFFTGLGYWTRANCEQCILGTIGNPKRKNGFYIVWAAAATKMCVLVCCHRIINYNLRF